MNAAPNETPRMTRVVVLPTFNSPLWELAAPFIPGAVVLGGVHASFNTTAAETSAAGKLRDLTARQGAALVAYTRTPSMLPRRTVFG